MLTNWNGASPQVARAGEWGWQLGQCAFRRADRTPNMARLPCRPLPPPSGLPHVRSHLCFSRRISYQVLDGYEWPFGSGRLLATIFSASNYAGKTRNKGAYALLGPPGSTTQDRPFCSVAAASADAASAVAAATARRSPRIAPPTKHRDGADGDSSSNLPTDGAANGYGQGIWCETFAFGVLKIINFEAELIPALRDVHRTTHRLAALVFARRDELAAAYRTADKRGTGTLTLPMWAAETQRVLRLPFSVLQMRYAGGCSAMGSLLCTPWCSAIPRNASTSQHRCYSSSSTQACSHPDNRLSQALPFGRQRRLGACGLSFILESLLTRKAPARTPLSCQGLSACSALPAG